MKLSLRTSRIKALALLNRKSRSRAQSRPDSAPKCLIAAQVHLHVSYWHRFEVALTRQFILDATVALDWLLRETAAAARYAASVAMALADEETTCVVPTLFHIEVASTLMRNGRNPGPALSREKKTRQGATAYGAPGNAH